MPPPRAGEQSQIPAATILAGSPPGSPGRRPSREADAVPVEVPSFAIDRLPYPNDPALEPRTAVSRAEARALCEERQQRLCHELEWERACKAPELGALSMGAEFREWTASRTTRGLGDGLRTAVYKGASLEAPAEAHRCAARGAATPDSRSKSLTFRCCAGEAPTALHYPVEPVRDPFAVREMDQAEARKLLASVPETKAAAATFRFFTNGDVDRALGKGGRTREGISPWVAVDDPLVWSPQHGEEAWVLTGDTQQGSLLALFYPRPDGTFLFGGSFALADEHSPIALAYHPDNQRELLWSTCWGCGAEGGAITFRDDARIVIVQR